MRHEILHQSPHAVLPRKHATQLQLHFCNLHNFSKLPVFRVYGLLRTCAQTRMYNTIRWVGQHMSIITNHVAMEVFRFCDYIHLFVCKTLYINTATQQLNTLKHSTKLASFNFISNDLEPYPCASAVLTLFMDRKRRNHKNFNRFMTNHWKRKYYIRALFAPLPFRVIHSIMITLVPSSGGTPEVNWARVYNLFSSKFLFNPHRLLLQSFSFTPHL